MADPFIGQITMFAGSFAPRGWALCDGQLLPIAQNSALFSILGTTYGGDGQTTFGLPDLRGRVPMHPGNGPGLTNRTLGQKGGAETVTLNEAQIPPHTHAIRGNTGAGDEASPAGGFPANSAATDQDLYAEDFNTDMGVTAGTGGGNSHDNVQPFQCINYIIALTGTYPSQN